MDWDWRARPTYESDRLGVDGRLFPVVFYNMKQPRLVENHEVDLMLDSADSHLQRELPFVALVLQRRGAGVIAARHRQTLAEWLVTRREALVRSDHSLVVVVPESIHRAVLRVVYRFRKPPIRTITTPDAASAAEAVRTELRRMRQPVSVEIEGFLQTLAR
ncbi:MAG: hypothetical protein KJO40_15485 [Deltaproteobacteria bacterium]|nr:hypothetical protein [Deltaproteobacteria bacterium]NND29592.1 hypothetical protein [Myxococcales bacterium]MBT8463598.1 hypothetical protein [Deltaproteobacteria bacterium]MBT8481379.1 hypothetical protein [Deltaproteobacteria bacterium]NNK08681.1 hypothetical protein [Myxococcales bacterium]